MYLAKGSRPIPKNLTWSSLPGALWLRKLEMLSDHDFDRTCCPHRLLFRRWQIMKKKDVKPFRKLVLDTTHDLSDLGVCKMSELRMVWLVDPAHALQDPGVFRVAESKPSDLRIAPVFTVLRPLQADRSFREAGKRGQITNGSAAKETTA